MEWFERLEANLEYFVTLIKFILESISVACVVLGLIKTLQLAISLNRRHHVQGFPFNRIRLRFGKWLALALEFQLGADIVGTTVAPSLQALGELALIAVIRTFLNYFLERELEAELAKEKENLTLSKIRSE